MCLICIPTDVIGQRRMSDPQELELWMVMNHLWCWEQNLSLLLKQQVL